MALLTGTDEWSKAASCVIGKPILRGDALPMINCRYALPEKKQDEPHEIESQKVKKKMAPKKRAIKAKASKKLAKKKAARKKIAQKKVAFRTRPGRAKNIAVNSETEIRREIRNRVPEGFSGRQSGDLQGLSRAEEADSESVEELIEEGNPLEAAVVSGVEEADDAEGREVHTHEVPEDDVPEEYFDKE